MIVKLLTEHYLEFLSLKGGCSGSSESTLVKMSNCWKSHAGAQLFEQVPCEQGPCHNIYSHYRQISQWDIPVTMETVFVKSA